MLVSVLRLVGSQCTAAFCWRALFSKVKLSSVAEAAARGTSVKNRPLGAAINAGALVVTSPRCCALPSSTAGLVLLWMVPTVSSPFRSLTRISVQSGMLFSFESVPPAARTCS